MSYVETYRQMIEKINNYDKIIERNGTSGKTLDMSGSGVKRKRSYTMRTKPTTPGGKTGFPKHIHEYGQFITSLRRIQALEHEHSKLCYLNV